MTSKPASTLEKSSGILESLMLAKSDATMKLHSRHWNVFGEEFLSKLKDPDELYNFRRSGLSRWLDDSNVDNDRAKIENYFASLIRTVGRDFFNRVAESQIGDPRTVDIDGMRVDFNDLFLVFFASRIVPFVSRPNPVIAEIGAGYGGLGVKLKRLIPTSTVVLFDLPEVNVIQHHYIQRNFPEARVLTYQELRTSYCKLNAAALSDYDFAILPGWLAAELEADSVDCFINTRSMMEMDVEVIRFYFDQIQRALRVNGFFYCVNRYVKNTVGYPIRIKDYPYDDRWYVAISGPSWRQPAIHEFGCVRTAHSTMNAASSFLRQLPPFDFKDALAHVESALKVVGSMARDKVRNSAVVGYLSRATGYQRYRESSQR